MRSYTNSILSHCPMSTDYIYDFGQNCFDYNLLVYSQSYHLLVHQVRPKQHMLLVLVEVPVYSQAALLAVPG
jgi:hypothetical protein